jgi:hypothetical protein
MCWELTYARNHTEGVTGELMVTETLLVPGGMDLFSTGNSISAVQPGWTLS